MFGGSQARLILRIVRIHHENGKVPSRIYVSPLPIRLRPYTASLFFIDYQLDENVPRPFVSIVSEYSLVRSADVFSIPNITKNTYL